MRARAQLRAFEREVFAMRRRARAQKALSATARGGLGAFVGACAAMVAHAFGVIDEPWLWFAMVVLGFVFGALLGMRWDPPDDGFPGAPPERFR